MPRASLTPTLDRLIFYPLQRGTWFPPGTTVGDCAQAERELRAVKAVLRSAEAFNQVHGHEGGSKPKTCPGCALDRALARLGKGTR